MVALAGSGWKLAPCLVRMFEEADKLWPKRSRLSDGSIGDLSHQARSSDHNPNDAGWVLAGDLTDDKANGCDADRFAEHLRTSRDPRVSYVICNGRIFRSYGSSAWSWTPYTGINAHEKHTHVSVLNTAAAIYDRSPWFDYAAPPELPIEEEDVQLIYVRRKDQARVHLASVKTTPRPVGLFSDAEWHAALTGDTVTKLAAGTPSTEEIVDGGGNKRRVLVVADGSLYGL